MKHLYRFFVDRPYKPQFLIANQYEVKRVIGMGSYGITYLSKNKKTRERCVVKQIRPSKLKNSNTSFYQMEAEILASLDHGSIPKLHDAFLFNRNQFLVMDYIEGVNLEDLLFDQYNRFNELESLEFLKGLIDIVAYLHMHEISHGDLRIPNVMVKNAQLYVIDFGLAVSLKNKSDQETLELIQKDLYDLGDFLLFLLYSSYDPTSRKDRPWTEELSIHPATEHFIKRLLQIETGFKSIYQVRDYLNKTISTIPNHKTST
ncbi:serine/threonine protein kinase [Pseudalkalibacillus hwajinpoensis]|uniref:serine/threonine protein kinase n=1 Tax=Guptibacillus hwajinpoensis TaxID=208199 RepID=UPI001CD260D5|nr:protein kinase family protein [Pseudalkalibacillus hwajinpoensis]MCA0992173.1 protein kinase family protein [Pseudalkalibacillus hwajinpoensis]